jgi:hypothetical protein
VAVRANSVESRGPLRSALTTFDLIGARNWADQARAELRAAGERAVVHEPSAQGVLSAHELQIARLAAEGHASMPARRLAISTIGSAFTRRAMKASTSWVGPSSQ